MNQTVPTVDPGQKLRHLRESLHLKFRDVEHASQRIAIRRGDPQFKIGLSRLADIESKATIPSMFRLYSLAAIYHLEFRTLLSWYGIDLDALPADSAAIPMPQSGPAEIAPPETISLPVLQIMNEGPEPVGNFCLGRHIREWGTIPVSLLANLDVAHYRCAFVGMEDTFMSPVLLPGAFVQVDEKLNRVAASGWQNEWDRPIYLIETREGYRFAWCSLRGSTLILQPHPASPHVPELLRYPSEAGIVGQVVAVAMRLRPEKPRHKRSAAAPG